MSSKLILLVYSTLFLCFCSSSPNDHQSDQGMNTKLSDYNISKPDKTIHLKSSLEEISGLSMYGSNRLACINDEDGKVFLLDLDKEEVYEKVKFGSSADYEAIEIVGHKLYCIKSNGKLKEFEIDDDFETKDEEDFDLDISSDNNIEGMTYDPKTGLIILAPKEENLDDDLDGRALYAFDPEKEEFDKKPFLVIKEKELKKKTGDKKFKSSGIAYNPQNDCFYMIATAGKMIIKVNRSGDILEAEKLDSKVLRQPEGIAFGPDGKLYIASEGKGRKGYIHIYKKNN